MLSMESLKVSPDDDIFDCPSITLLDLPVEVFLHICSFLDVSTLVHGLGCACKQFYEILRDDSLWKVRIGQIWRNARFPILPPDEHDKLFWKQSCVNIEKHVSFWKNNNAFYEMNLKDGHCSIVDTLMLIERGQFLISGGRDRNLCCWDLRSGKNERALYDITHMSHAGWIWDLTAVDRTFYSCSWDGTVKSWHINYLHLVLDRNFDMDVAGALLCIASFPGVNVLATGSHCRTVILFDPRVGQAPIARYRYHRGGVLKVAINENYVLSASKDKTVIVWDQRAGRILKTIQISRKFFPMSMIMEKQAVYVGDSGGKLHLLNPRDDFKVVKSYETGHTRGIKGLCSTPGGLITGSLDNTVRLFTPTDPPQLIRSLLGCVGEVASMDYVDNILAIAGTYIQLWRPNIGLRPENCA